MASVEPDPVALIYELSDLLDTIPESVEVLPGAIDQWIIDDALKDARPSHAHPFLFTDNHLGVPQKTLFKLYIAATALFAESRRTHDPRGLRSASAVLLLANGAHNTALNTRKRLVARGVLAPAHELALTGAFLTTREGAPQSLLWDHRRWLLAHIYGAGSASTDALRTELAVAARACEVRPRNYHAWTHWGVCAALLCARGPGRAAALAEMGAHLRDWVARHVADASAVHHLCALAREAGADVDPNAEVPGDLRPAALLAHALGLVAAYPTHEALWAYVRGAIIVANSTVQAEMVVQVQALPILEGPYQHKFNRWWEHKLAERVSQ